MTATLSFTRAQIAERLELTPAILEHWERMALISPSVRKARAGQTSPNLYSPADVAVVQFLAGTRALGIPRSAIGDAAARLAADHQLVPGWRGWVAMDPDQQLVVTVSAAHLVEFMTTNNNPSMVLIRLEVPETPT
jgi:DNA-binding transcriptional MerR regulator